MGEITIKQLSDEMGNLTTLSTTDKTSLVGAINENTASLNDNVQQLMDVRPFKATTRRPIITFTCDGGSPGDYEKVLPLAKTYGFAFTSAIATDVMDNPTAGKMSWEQMKEMQDVWGCEIASHSRTHPHLSQLTESQIIDELKGSKEILESHGLKVKNIIYPYGDSDKKVRSLVAKYYRCGVKVSGQLDGNGIATGINTGVVPSMNLCRIALGSYFDYGMYGNVPTENTYEYYKYWIDQAVTQNGWLIFMMHPSDTAHDATQQAILEQVIQYIKSINVDILTLDQGYDIFGNVLESGDYIGFNSGLGISKDGNTANLNTGLKLIPNMIYENGTYTPITNVTPITKFLDNTISICAFPVSANAGFPTSAGTLETYRIRSVSFGFQLWYDYGAEKVYRRRCSNDGATWNNWVEISISGYNNYEVGDFKTATDLISTYPNNKITIFKNSSSNTAGFPDNSVGLITTYKYSLGVNGIDRQEFRKYNTSELWSRYVDSTGAWTAWVKYVTKPEMDSSIAYTIAGANTYTATQLITAFPTGKVTVFRVNVGGATGFPNTAAGICTTYNFGINGIDRQEFRPASTNELWGRYTDGSGNWTAWVKMSVV